MPSIVKGLLIQYVFCFKLGWFPLTMSTSDQYFTWEVFHSMLPAVFSLCLGSIAGYTRFTRAELSEVLTGEFMLLARTKGLTKRQAVMRHAMRNSMVVIFPAILGEIIGLISGAMITEKMFAINGIGGLYLNSITFQDYDFFMLLTGFYTLISLLAGIIGDISYSIIDPRIRMGAK
jgi:oligopeptide transport system permease protein